MIRSHTSDTRERLSEVCSQPSHTRHIIFVSLCFYLEPVDACWALMKREIVMQTSFANLHELTDSEVWENQRWYPVVGFSPKLPDRPAFSNWDGTG
jgi:hypothetical protein